MLNCELNSVILNNVEKGIKSLSAKLEFLLINSKTLFYTIFYLINFFLIRTSFLKLIGIQTQWLKLIIN